ncbi:SDR family NAD(P)-dependent oxidoreductase [Steroidobacter sp.]|uniref:SDR family NAD(P)-dependent oxidoreductase n=1 Tax=Steroidobacter sp. TaxID=1978227 RepID=UPI001A52A6F7|nr:SDR family NAD(P)-dependent oxidoreductase [Steroidobacter sp.]MBL8271749.1 SDR family NAD(P)-dependent oxidoreductase [Steroidobacter sp.]
MNPRFARLNARFPHKRAFITGAGSGLGLALAKALASDGWTLGLFDRNLERLTSVEAEFADAGVKLVAYPGDVTQSDELTVAVNSFAASHDGLDVMINNAGVASAGSLMEVSLEDWRWIIDINLMGVVHGSRAAVPHLQRNGSGLLINVSSAAAFASAPGMISYNATKAAVVSISETLVNELRPMGTQVSVAMPTFFRSSLLETLRGPEHARARAHEAMQRSEYPAEAAAYDLLTEAADGRTYILLPKAARMMWRMKRWMPLRFLDRVRHFTRRQPTAE